MPKVSQYAGPVDVILADSTNFRAQAQLHSSGQNLTGSVNVQKQFEHLFTAGDVITLRLTNAFPPGAARKFAVNGVVSLSAQHAQCFVQVTSQGGWTT